MPKLISYVDTCLVPVENRPFWTKLCLFVIATFPTTQKNRRAIP